MIGSNQYELTWNHFDQLHADKKREFENLSRSLFLRELCFEGTILHSDPNHPGIEVAPVLAKDGQTRISFQAKHFDGQIGYAKIRKSIEEAVAYYTDKLDIIYLYCNKDIAETSNSYREIIKTLSKAGIKMKLVTGQAILDQAMNHPPILSCYFGLDSLDENWFKRNINLSLENLGRRYNSLFNVDTDAQTYISLFLKETSGVVELNNKKKKLIDVLKDLKWRCGEKYEKEIAELLKWAKSIIDVDKKTVNSSLNWKEYFESRCNKVFAKFRDRLANIQKELEIYSYDDQEYDNLRKEEYQLKRILAVTSYLDISKMESSLINCKIAIITGDMGTGKTQLLATSAKSLVDNGRSVLLLLGQTFITDEHVERQIMQNLEGMSTEQSFESLVSVMDEKGALLGEDAIIIIDAINESKNRDVWKQGINSIIAILKQYSHVKLVVSLRTGFESLTLSQSILDKIDSGDIALIEHTGLLDKSPRRIYEFLSCYGIPFSPEFYLHSEMTNPLFLTWFCNTYNGEEQGLFVLIDKVLNQADQEGSIGAGFAEPLGMLKPLIEEMISESTNGVVTKETLLGLSSWSIYGVGNKIGYLKAIERAGILTSFIREQEEYYYIGYNLLEDYLKADRIVDREQTKKKITKYCEKILFDIDDDGNINNYGNESIFAMVASLFSMKNGEELLELIDRLKNSWEKNKLVDEYFTSFIWRSSYVTYDKFFETIKKYKVNRRRVWEVFIENGVKENSELNALGLTKLLNRYPMNRRDILWTTVINDFDENDRIISLAYYIEAGNTLRELTENKVYLLSVIYTWMLSSSNRVLRDRVSKALIELLKDHFSVCIRLLELFDNVNDPYILQRLYGVVFGAVMKRNHEDKSSFKTLAQWVYKEIFDKDKVYPDILLRDYARLIIERFAIEYPDDLGDIQLHHIKPPYKSERIPIVEKVDYSVDEYLERGLGPLLFSMKFDMKVMGLGMYGDFGRYVFQSALDCFLGLDIANIYYYAIQYILNDLGYEPEWFAEYDKHINGRDRYDVRRIERIGKKYQWIAMYNILARVSDSYKIKSWDWNDKTGMLYEGPWNPYVRDFDPTLNINIKVIDNMPQISVPVYGKECFCSIDSSEKDIKKWILEDDIMFQDFPSRFIHKDKDGQEWVSLYIYQNNKLLPEKEKDSVFGFIKGEQHIWTIATMYVLPKMKNQYIEQDLFDSGFVRRSSNGMHSCYKLFSREYAWSPGYDSEFSNVFDDEDGNGLNAFSAAVQFLWEKGYDASQNETTSFAIPAGDIIQTMQLYEKSVDGVYYRNEQIVALDLSLARNDNTEIVIRRDVFNEYIVKTGAQAFWTVVGEKQFFLESLSQSWKRREGYFIYGKDRIVGSIRLAENI